MIHYGEMVSLELYQLQQVKPWRFRHFSYEHHWRQRYRTSPVTRVAKVEQLPDTTGMKNEVLLFKGQRNRYDGAFQIPGARIVEFGHVDSAREYHLESAITDQTCAVANVIGPFIRKGLGLAKTIEIAHAHGLPVIVDAAAEVPPRENLSRFIGMGADMVALDPLVTLNGSHVTPLSWDAPEMVASSRGYDWMVSPESA